MTKRLRSGAKFPPFYVGPVIALSLPARGGAGCDRRIPRMSERATAEVIAFGQATDLRPRPTMLPTSKGKIIGHHDTIRGALRTLQRVAPSSCTVLITGESGT